jgi:hypothetical protein
MMKIILPVVLMLFLASCENHSGKFPQSNIESKDIHVNIHRYGKALFELDTNDFKNGLKGIKNDFLVFLNADLDDSANLVQLFDYVTDTQLISISHKVNEEYPSLDQLEKELSHAFGRYHHYYPGNRIPEVYTYISGLHYEMPVWKNDSVLIIALDLYLGEDYDIYREIGLPHYKVRCMTSQNLPVDVMKTIYLNDVSVNTKKRTLLDYMVEGGKMLSFLDAVLPGVNDSLKICYPANKLDWAKNNEKRVWGFLIEKDLLYSTDYQTITKFIQDGPFTTGFSNDSPSRLGIFIGWQIVNQFLENNPDVIMEQMLKMKDSQTILQRSGYRPTD